MMKLPSGRRAGITNIRARYHATRRNLKIDVDTPLVTLMELVDIVEWRSESDRSFSFSGHTLADFPNVGDWESRDLEMFLQWLEDPSQYRQVEKARQRVVMDDLPLRIHNYYYPELLYSSLRQRLHQMPQQRANAGQWRGTLSNLLRAGLKQEELARSGLYDYLDVFQDTHLLTKEQLLGAIDFSSINLDVTNELVSGGGCGLVFEEVAESVPTQVLIAKGYKLDPGERGLIRYQDTGYHYRVGLVRGGLRWFLLDPSGRPLNEHGEARAEWFNSAKDAMEIAERHGREHFELAMETRPCGRYEHKSLCGGEDYREWLVSLPEYPHSFFGSHYYERNLLLHFRTKLREDVEGRRLLFIEELQSDWHQQKALPRAPFRNQWVSLAMKMALMHVAEMDLDGIAWTNGQEQAMHYGREIPRVCRIYDQEIPKVLERLGAPWNASVGNSVILTKEPRLHARKESDKWKVLDLNGDFETRPRYSQREAIELMARHCRSIDLGVPLFVVSSNMKQHIMEHGLPLFGEHWQV